MRQALEHIHTLEIQLQHERNMRQRHQTELQQQQEMLHMFQQDGRQLAEATVNLANQMLENLRR